MVFARLALLEYKQSNTEWKNKKRGGFMWAEFMNLATSVMSADGSLCKLRECFLS